MCLVMKFYKLVVKNAEPKRGAKTPGWEKPSYCSRESFLKPLEAMAYPGCQTLLSYGLDSQGVLHPCTPAPKRSEGVGWAGSIREASARDSLCGLEVYMVSWTGRGPETWAVTGQLKLFAFGLLWKYWNTMIPGVRVRVLLNQ